MHSIVKALATGKNFLSRHKIMAAALVAVGLISVIAYSAQAITGAEIASAANPLNLLMVGLAIIINWIAWAVGKLIVIVIGMIVIPILGYNNFGDSNIINIGWPLVRDVVNMFVIIILLVIAIQTILGIAKASISQQLPRLFLAVIAVNFSRMFTVLMIDAGQVVMFTFVNALRDIAAGNFIGLFQINSFMGFSPEQSFNALTQGGISAGGFLGSAYITLSLLLMVLGVLLIMAVVFIYRIVILWILVILSPVAFFLAATFLLGAFFLAAFFL
ncbi:hypothetical protein IH979_02705, partial [Patescibacteria group bacterium]|nr:hypothetical protein [Patescibacteria group bacterium]